MAELVTRTPLCAQKKKKGEREMRILLSLQPIESRSTEGNSRLEHCSLGTPCELQTRVGTPTVFYRSQWLITGDGRKMGYTETKVKCFR